MTSCNEITKDPLITKPTTDAYRSGWDNVQWVLGENAASPTREEAYEETDKKREASC